jgi:hypothetical protein
MFSVDFILKSIIRVYFLKSVYPKYRGITEILCKVFVFESKYSEKVDNLA